MLFEKTVSIKLNKPFQWEGRQIDTVDLDFSRAIGAVITKAEREVFQGGSMTIVRPMNSEYCARIAASISGLSYRSIEKLHACDFDPIWQTVAAFVGNRDPQKFYDQFLKAQDENDEDDENFYELSDEDEESGEDFMPPPETAE